MNDDGIFGGSDEDLNIDLTPMIDCLFMLIIFFVLTMSFSRPVLEIILPKATNAVSNQERNELLLNVKADGTLWVHGEEIAKENLPALLDEEDDKLLNIYMDEKAPFSSFIYVLDLAKVKRSGKFVISTRDQSDDEPAGAEAGTYSAREKGSAEQS